MENTLFKNEFKRDVICADALEWLFHNREIDAIITSLPDMEEISETFENWVKWIKTVCQLISQSVSDNGIIIFYQTDRKYDGRIIDKKTIISNEFITLGYKNIFNKIVLKQDPETTNLFRPTFTNMFGFSKNITSGKATPDVIYSGKMLYKNAMGFNACEVAIKFIESKIGRKTIVDPFCGRGSVLKIANIFKFDSIGIDISWEQCEFSKNI